MKTYKIDTIILVLLSAIALLSGCGEEPKEADKTAQVSPESKPAKPEQVTSETQPTQPVEQVTETLTETIGKSGDTLEGAAETTVEKTAEVTQDLTDASETAATIAVATVKEVVSDASDVVEPTPALVRKMQKALSDAGFRPGPVDGVIGPKTKAALQSFQKQKGLAVGQITKETLRALGVAD